MEQFDFYPTPIEVIKIMVDYYFSNRFSIKNILEPSAGDGRILEYIHQNYHNKTACCELHIDRQIVLQSKYKFLGHDFLAINFDNYYFDLIVMNPPFSQLDKHVEKAWNVTSKHLCFLMPENYLNNNRHIIVNDIINRCNKKTIENLGNCFHNGDVPTDVKIVLVRLEKEECSKSFNFDFTPEFETSKEFKFEDINQLMINEGKLPQLINDYTLLINETKLFMLAYSRYSHYLKTIGINITELMFQVIKDSNGVMQLLFTNTCDAIKTHFWNKIFKHFDIESLSVRSVRDTWNKFRESNQNLVFNEHNIYNVINTLLSNTDNILNQSVCDVFDIMTKYHEENRCYKEGWKTNDSWKVNKKVILPNYVISDWGNTFRTSHYRSGEYTDIDKVMCIITGKKFKDIKSIHDTVDKIKLSEKGVWFESEFFNIKCFLKGTLHLEFKDEMLWQKFNVIAAKGKSQLPEAKTNP